MAQDLSRLNALRKVFSRTQAAALEALTAGSAPAAPIQQVLTAGLAGSASLGFNPARASYQSMRWTLGALGDIGGNRYNTAGILTLPVAAGEADLLVLGTSFDGTFGVKKPGLYQITGEIQAGWVGVPAPNHARAGLGVSYDTNAQGMDWFCPLPSYPPQTVFHYPSNTVPAINTALSTPVFYLAGPLPLDVAPCQLFLQVRNDVLPALGDLAGVAGPVVIDLRVNCLDSTG